jgi:hypothetical protein
MASLTLRGLCLSLLATLIFASPICAQHPARDRSRLEPHGAAPRPLTDALGPDGTLRAGPGRRATYDAKGWRLAPGLGGAPRFVPAARATAEDDAWSDVFSSPGTDDVIRAVAVLGDEVFIGGQFAVIGKASANNVARWDGERWQSLGEDAENGVNGTVYSLAVTNDAVYVGGTFTKAGSVAASNIARWDGTGWNALGTPEANGVGGFGQIVYAIAVDNTQVFVGGLFSEAGGAPAANLAVWDRTTNAWSEFGGVARMDPEDPAFVLAITVSRKDVYVGGKFDRVGGVDASYIARFNRKQQVWLSLGSGTDDWVSAIAVKGKRVYAGGFFSHAGGQQAYFLAQWDGAGWQPLDAGLSSEGYDPGAGVRVKGLAVHRGSLYVTGYFTHAGGSEVNSVAEWRGGAWRPLEGGLKGGIAVPVLGDTLAMASARDGIVVVGAFNHAGTDRAFQVAKWSPAAASWRPIADEGSHQGAYEGFVTTVAVDQGNVYVGGGEMIIGGVVAFGIARWDGAVWSTLGEGAANGVNGFVNAIAPTGDGGLIVGGLFTRAGAVTAINIAKWDGAAWSDLGLGVGGSADSQVLSIAVDGDDVYAGGIFPVAGEIEVNNIARWDGASWSALSGGIPTGIVGAVAASGGVVYAAGQFPEAGGVSASNIARWDGSRWAPLRAGGADGVDGAVLALALDGDRLYVGGEFTAAGGANAKNLAVWSNGAWSELGGGINPVPGDFGYVTALAVDFRGRLLVGGFFSAAGDLPANHVAVWDGTSWSTLGSGTNNTVFGIATNNGGSIFATGAFARAGGKPSLRVAEWREVSGKQ